MASSKTVVLVTGANGGIGYETVLALSTASADYHIFLGSRSIEKGEAALRTMQEAHGSALKGTIAVLQLEITDPASIQSAKTAIESQSGKLDALINNAGIIAYQEPDMVKGLRQTFEVNLYGQVLVAEALEPLLRKSTGPYVVYVSSEQGSITQRLNPGYPHVNTRGDHYRVSKAALNMLAACTRHNYAEWGCAVVAFNPGWCITNLTGEEGRSMRAKLGARDPREPALALVDIISGKRDADVAKNGMLDVDGGIVPW